ncbi:MAG: hypothetical protein LUB59_03415 [Candidatus Gastranaerophilales bacterium]|nr:hypothetical protein [Candidatus Gastranaerophilales bacterium]
MKKIFSVSSTIDDRYHVMQILGIQIKTRKNWYKLSQQIDRIIQDKVCIAQEIKTVHSASFTKYKNINAGKNVTIIGSGPTLKYYNNEADYENITLNLTVFSERIKSKYMFSHDAFILLKRMPDFIDRIKGLDCIKFVGHSLNPYYMHYPEIIDEQKYNIYRYYVSRRAMDTYTDITSHPFLARGSVAFPALDFALYTHPKKIYLVGLDTAPNGHAFCKNTKIMPDSLKRMLYGYKKLKTFAAIHYPDIEIISVNPVGLIGMFKDVYTHTYVNENPELFKKMKNINYI